MIGVYIVQPSDSGLCEQTRDFSSRLEAAIESDSRCKLRSSPDGAQVVLLNQAWETRGRGAIRELETCSFVEEFHGRLLTISHDDVSTVFLPGLYTSLTPRNHWPQWSLPCGYKRLYRPEEQDRECVQGSGHQPEWLFSFRGVDFSHPVRKRLVREYGGRRGHSSVVIVNRKFHSHTERERRAYVSELLNSHFVLAPRGFSPSTYRLFEAMQFGRCPVIISDEWQPIPGIDWNTCSLRIAEKDVSRLEGILREREGDAAQLGQTAQDVWRDHFADGARERGMLSDLLDLHHTCKRPRDFESLKRLWHSRAFYRAHGWTVRQRVARKASSLWLRPTS